MVSFLFLTSADSKNAAGKARDVMLLEITDRTVQYAPAADFHFAFPSAASAFILMGAKENHHHD